MFPLPSIQLRGRTQYLKNILDNSSIILLFQQVYWELLRAGHCMRDKEYKVEQPRKHTIPVRMEFTV